MQRKESSQARCAPPQAHLAACRWRPGQTQVREHWLDYAVPCPLEHVVNFQGPHRVGSGQESLHLLGDIFLGNAE